MKNKVLKTATFMVNPTGALLGMLVESVANSTPAAEEIRDKDLADLEKIALRQELEMKMAKAQAKVVQELAIARRIQAAEEVDIEEFYDINADASAGVGTDGQNINLGLKASGQKVAKRVIRFRGFMQSDDEAFTQEN